MVLEPIHALKHSGVGVAENTRNAAHEFGTRPVPFEGMFRISRISLPKRVAKHDHGQQDDGDCKGHSVRDLGRVRVGGFIGHVLH